MMPLKIIQIITFSFLLITRDPRINTAYDLRIKNIFKDDINKEDDDSVNTGKRTPVQLISNLKDHSVCNYCESVVLNRARRAYLSLF